METKGWSVLSRLMRVDQKTYLPDAMLTKVDRASMAVSLEVRVPLLDHRVVEFTSSLPDSLKYRGGTGKYLLRKLLSRYVPEGLFERPKMGFGVPIEKWFRGELKEILLGLPVRVSIKRGGAFRPLSVSRCNSRNIFPARPIIAIGCGRSSCGRCGGRDGYEKADINGTQYIRITFVTLKTSRIGIFSRNFLVI